MYKYSVISAILVLACNLIAGHGQYELFESPCPNIFEYIIDGSGVYGLIHLRSTGPVSSVIIRANFTIAAKLLKDNVGRLSPISKNLHLLHDFNRGAPLDYRVDFPTASALPRLTALIANDNILCYGPGDIPSPHQYVASFSLQHNLFLKGHEGNGFHGNKGFYGAESKPEQDPNIAQFLEQLGNEGNIEVYKVGDDKSQGPWNAIIIEQPATEPPPKRHPATQNFSAVVTRPPKPPPQRPPEPQYNPEVVTRPPRPQTQPPPLPQPTRPPPPTQPPPTAPSIPVVISDPLQEPVQCGVVAGGNERVPLIFKGQSYNRGDWPWVVAIYKRKDASLNFICSGTLVSARHVVTAAHCMQQKNRQSSQRDIVVKVGVYNLEDWGDDVTVTRTLTSAYLHENYNSSSLANDISVLVLQHEVTFNTNIRPACLWSGNADLSRIVGASGVVAGWGQSELGTAGRGEPRVVRIPVVSTAVCRASRPDFHKLTSSNTLCAGDRNGSGPCLGDSGGGLYLLEGGRWRIRGVVSLSLRPDNGDSTCNLDEYIVFTDSAQYLSWIQTIMTY